MKKNLRLITITIITIILISIIYHSKTIEKNTSNKLESFFVDAEKISSIENNRIVNNGINLSIKANGYELIFDKLNNKYMYSMVENDIDKYNPLLSFNKEYGLVILKEDIDDKFVSSNSNLLLVIYDDKYYKETYLSFTSLPILSIYANIDNMIDSYRNTYKESSATYCLYDNRDGVIDREVLFKGKINARGQSTIKYPKKGYELTIISKEVEDNKQQKYDLLGLGERTEYILYAGYNDYEKIRNVFCSYIWKECFAGNNVFEIDNGSEYKYVEVFVNDSYYGLYALGYKNDEASYNLSINETLYKKTLPSYSESDYDFTNPSNNGYEISSGANTWEYLNSFYHSLLKESNYETLTNIVDIDNSIDTYLFINIIQGVDHVISSANENQKLFNLYLCAKQYNDKFVIIYTPWDFDRSFGKSLFDEEEYTIPTSFNVEMEMNVAHILLHQNDTDISEKIKRRYIEIRQKTLSDDNIISILNKYEYDIYDSGAFIRDKERWPNGLYNDEETKLSNFKLYVLNRLNYLDSYISN